MHGFWHTQIVKHQIEFETSLTLRRCANHHHGNAIAPSFGGPVRNRTIWMFWDKGENDTGSASVSHKRSGSIRRMAFQGWRALNPTWQVVVLDTARAMKLAPRFARAVRHAGGSICMPLLADLLRTELLAQHGGVWVDTSLVPIQPLDRWLDRMLAPAGFWAFSEWHGHPLNKSLGDLPGGKRGDCTKLDADHRYGSCSAYFASKTKHAATRDAATRCLIRQRPRNCHSWIYSDGNLNLPLQGVTNWFLAVSQPHHPLVDAWLAQYERNLWRIITATDPFGPLYFLHGCSLVSLHGLGCVRATLEAMPVPVSRRDRHGHPIRSPSYIRSVVDPDYRLGNPTKIDRKQLMIKRPEQISEETYANYLARFARSASPPASAL